MSAFARVSPATGHPPPRCRRELCLVEAAAKGGKKETAALWKSFQTAVTRVKSDGQWGEVIPHLPAYFVERYGARNLYGVDLAFFHRAFYTIHDRDVLFLDLVDHTRYDKWFPGRGRR